MEFGEVLVFFCMFVLLPAVILNGIAKIKAVKSKAGSGSGDEMSASELRALVREAAEEAVAPLSARLADLEERLGDESVASIRARIDPALLADALETDLSRDDDEPTAAVRRRTR